MRILCVLISATTARKLRNRRIGSKSLVYAWGSKYDTFGLARQFTTHAGNVITIPAGGDYGWCINKDKTIADVTDAVT